MHHPTDQLPVGADHGKRRNRRILLLAAALVAVLVVVAVVALDPSGAGDDRAADDVPLPIARYRVLDADAKGALIATRRGVMGVSRSGRVVWRDDQLLERGPEISCTATCPEAVVWSSDASIGRPEVPDPPEIRLTADGRDEQPVRIGSTGGKRSYGLLAANGVVVTLESDLRGVQRVVVRQGGRERYTMKTRGVLDARGYSDRSGDRLALALDLGAAGVRGVWLRRRGDELVAVREFGPLPSPYGCAAADLRSLIALGQRPVEVAYGASTPTAVPEVRDGGACSVVPWGVVYTTYASTERGPELTVTGAARSGRLWKRRYRGVGSVSSGTNGLTAVARKGGTLLLDRTGHIVQRVKGTADAMMTGDELVAVSPTGRVTWTKAAAAR